LMTDAVVIPCCGNSYCDECKLTAVMLKLFHPVYLIAPIGIHQLPSHR
jgi:hypothetical protein